eukprot:TRINITY_DN11789_c3_g1_i1.p1 TRINITY_DN11789_c3_g1~~TRINITY_DN11789_c3_g1_i1.p1  ORF type:complete len:2817 (+),score=550.30 TRINITY_DN11789_c3_g1_i1:74-8524(+)
MAELLAMLAAEGGEGLAVLAAAAAEEEMAAGPSWLLQLCAEGERPALSELLATFAYEREERQRELWGAAERAAPATAAAPTTGAPGAGLRLLSRVRRSDGTRCRCARLLLAARRGSGLRAIAALGAAAADVLLAALRRTRGVPHCKPPTRTELLRRRLAELPPRLVGSTVWSIRNWEPPRRLPGVPRCAACAAAAAAEAARRQPPLPPPHALLPPPPGAPPQRKRRRERRPWRPQAHWQPTGKCRAPPPPRPKNPLVALAAVASGDAPALRALLAAAAAARAEQRQALQLARRPPRPSAAGCREAPPDPGDGYINLAVTIQHAQVPLFWLQLRRGASHATLREALQRHCEADGMLKRRRWRFVALPYDAALDELERDYLQALDAVDSEWDNIKHAQSIVASAERDLLKLGRRKDAFRLRLLRAEEQGLALQEAFREREGRYSVIDKLPVLPARRDSGPPLGGFLYPYTTCRNGSKWCLSVCTIAFTDAHCEAEQVQANEHKRLHRIVRAGDASAFAEWAQEISVRSPVGLIAHLNWRHPLFGHGVLHIAARAGHTALVAALLQFGCRAHIRDLRGRTPLHEAASRGRAGVVAELLRGAAAQVRPPSATSTPGLSDEEGSDAGGGGTAPPAGNGGNPVCAPPVGLCRFPLLGGARAARLARRRLAEDCSVDDAPSRRPPAEQLWMAVDLWGRSALVLAAQGGHQSALRALITGGALGNEPRRILGAPDEHGFAVGRRLAELACPITAAAAGNVGVVSVWYEQLGWTTGKRERLSKGTLLHWAAAHGRSVLCRLLIVERGEDPGALNAAGRSPVHEAAMRSDTTTFDALTSSAGPARAEELARQTVRGTGQSCVHLALARRRTLTDKLCLRVLRVSTNWDPAAPDAHGRSALHMACAAGRSAVLSAFTDRVDFTKPQSDARRALNSRDNSGDTPLGCAIAADSAGCTEALLRHKLVDPTAECSHDRSPLLVAVEARALPRRTFQALPAPAATASPLPQVHRPHSGARRRIVALMLLDKVPDSEVVRLSGPPGRRRAPLHSAVRQRDYELASALMARGASAHAAPDSGHTPLHAAAHLGGAAMVRLLVANTRGSVGGCEALAAVLAADRAEAHDPLFLAEVVAMTLPDLLSNGPPLLADACRRGQFRAARVLLDAGCAVAARPPSARARRSSSGRLPPITRTGSGAAAGATVHADAAAADPRALLPGEQSAQFQPLAAALSAKRPDADLAPLADTLYLKGGRRGTAGEAPLAARAGLWKLLARAVHDPSCKWDFARTCPGEQRNCLHYACLQGPVGAALVPRLLHAAGRASASCRDRRGWLPAEYALIRPDPRSALALLCVSPEAPRGYDALCARAVSAGAGHGARECEPGEPEDRGEVEALLSAEVAQGDLLRLGAGRLRAQRGAAGGAVVPPQAGPPVRRGGDSVLFAAEGPGRAAQLSLCRRIACGAARLAAAGARGTDTTPGTGPVLLLHWAALRGDAALVRAVLDAQHTTQQQHLANAIAPGGLAASGPLPVPEGATALYVAAARCRATIAEILLAAPGTAVGARTAAGESPLAACMRQGSTELARLLLRHGAAAATATVPCSRPLLLVHRAPGRQGTRTERAAVTATGLTPLTAFARCAVTVEDAAELALWAPHCPAEMAAHPLRLDGHRVSPVHVMLGGLPRPLPPSTVLSAATNALVQAPGGLPALALERADAGGRTAVEWALSLDRGAFAAHLISAHGAPAWAPLVSGGLAVHRFSRNGDAAGVKACFFAADRPSDTAAALATVDGRGDSVLHCALQSVGKGVDKVVGTLIWNGAPLQCANSVGRSIIMLAARHGRLGVVVDAATIFSWAGVKHVDARGWTALHHAAAAGQLSDAQLLVQNGAPMDVRAGPLGATPLALAALCGREEVALWMLSRAGAAGIGAQHHLRSGETLLHLAAMRGLSELAEAVLTQADNPEEELALINAETGGDGDWGALSALGVSLCWGGMPRGARLGRSTPADSLCRGLWARPAARQHPSVQRLLSARLLPRYAARQLLLSQIAHYAYGEEGCWFMGRGVPHVELSLSEQMWEAAESGADDGLLRLVKLGDEDEKAVILSGLPRPAQAARAKWRREGWDDVPAERDIDPARALQALRAAVIQALSRFRELRKVQLPSPEEAASRHWDRTCVLVFEFKAEARRLAAEGSFLFFDRWRVRTELAPARGPPYRADFVEGCTSVVHVAARRGCFQALDHLVKVNMPLGDTDARDAMRRVMEMRDASGHCPLHYALAVGDWRIAALLLGAGVRVEVRTAQGMEVAELLHAPRSRRLLMRAMTDMRIPLMRMEWLPKLERNGRWALPPPLPQPRRPPMWLPGDHPHCSEWFAAPVPDTEERFADGDAEALFIASTNYEQGTAHEGSPEGRETVKVMLLPTGEMQKAIDRQLNNIRSRLLRLADGFAACASRDPSRLEQAQPPGVVPLQQHAADGGVPSEDLGGLVGRIKAHLATGLQLQADLDTAEGLPSAMRPRALTVLRYALGGGRLGREVYEALSMLLCDRGAYGARCLLLLRCLSVSFVESPDEAAVGVLPAGGGLQLEVRAHCAAGGIFCAGLAERLDRLFACREVAALGSAAAAAAALARLLPAPCALAAYGDDAGWEAGGRLAGWAAAGDLTQLLRDASAACAPDAEAAWALRAALRELPAAAPHPRRARPHPLREWLRKHRSLLGQCRVLHLIIAPPPARRTPGALREGCFEAVANLLSLPVGPGPADAPDFLIPGMGLRVLGQCAAAAELHPAAELALVLGGLPQELRQNAAPAPVPAAPPAFNWKVLQQRRLFHYEVLRPAAAASPSR